MEWNRVEKSPVLSVQQTKVWYECPVATGEGPAAIRTRAPILPANAVYYFEITILSCGQLSYA